MPKFDSPIGTKQFQGTPMRDITIPDESGFTPPIAPPHRHVQEQEHIQFDPVAMRDFQAAMGPQHPPVQMKEMTETEKNILEIKRAKREGKERMSDGARRRIEMLIGMTQLSKTVDVGETTFVLQTLRNKEARDALTAAAEYDGTVEFSFEYSKQLLARSITQVAGVDLDQFISSSELEAKLDFVQELPQALFTRLYNEYVALDNEARDKFTLKTESQVKEVVEDLKK